MVVVREHMGLVCIVLVLIGRHGVRVRIFVRLGRVLRWLLWKLVAAEEGYVVR